MIKSAVKWSLYSDVVDVLGVQASVYFIQATADSLKTPSYSAPPWSFDWISPIFGEIQSNDNGGALYEAVFKLSALACTKCTDAWTPKTPTTSE